MELCFFLYIPNPISASENRYCSTGHQRSIYDLARLVVSFSVCEGVVLFVMFPMTQMLMVAHFSWFVNDHGCIAKAAERLSVTQQYVTFMKLIGSGKHSIKHAHSGFGNVAETVLNSILGIVLLSGNTSVQG